MIRDVQPDDAAQICSIYNYYVLNTTITFEETAVSEEEMRARIIQITKKNPWIVYEEDGIVIGYAYASEWKSRCAYKYSVETTVYLLENAKGHGIGSTLYKELLTSLKSKNIHAAIGGIALPNAASVALHEKMGFEKVAQFKEVGYKFEKWIDVGYWELIFG